MLQRPPLYLQSQVESLYAQNNQLRQRLRKMSQIEPYVELLLQNNKQYQDDIHALQADNNKLRGRVDAVLEEGIAMKEAHKREVAEIRAGFESDIERLIRELKQILKDKETMQTANKSLIEDLTSRCKRDLDLKKRHIEDLELESGRKINKLTETVKAKDKAIEELTWQFRESEAKLVQEVDDLHLELNKVAKDKDLLCGEFECLAEEKRVLMKKNKQLAQENEQINRKFLKNDQEKSESMLQLRSKNSQLTKVNSQLDQQLCRQEKLINEHARKIAQLTKQCDELCRLKNETEGHLRRNLRAHEDLKAQLNEAIAKLDLVSKTTSEQLKKQAEELSRISDQNKRLQRQNIELRSEGQSKASEISDLIRAIEKMERKLADCSDKNRALQDQNSKKTYELKNTQEQLEDAFLEKKSLSEKVNLYCNHNSTLEQMLDKEKRRNVHLETSRFQFESMAMGALSRPEEICREYEREIQKIIQQFMIEKQEIRSSNQNQLMKLRAAYEQALKQKDDYFSRKIAFLEKELVALRNLR